MRKSTLKSRLLCTGFTTGALVAALLVAPQAASAGLTTPVTSVTPSSGTATGTVTAVLSTFMAGVTGTTGAMFVSAATCPTNYTTVSASATAVDATATKVDANTATVPVPNSLTPNYGSAKPYILCIYNGTGSGTSTLLGDGYYNVTPLTVAPSSGPATGTLTVSLTGFLSGVTTALGGAVTTTTPCPVNWASLTAGVAGANVTPVKVNDDKATVVLPTGPALNSGLARQYSVCVYNGATTAATLLGEGVYTVAPVATLTPATGPSGGGNLLTVTAPTGTVLPSSTMSGYVAISSCPAVLPSSTNSAYQATVVRNSTGSAATFTVPAGAAGSGSTATPYVACLYGGTTAGTSALVATSGSNVYNVTLPKIDLSSSTGGPNSGSFFASSTTSFLTTAPTPGGIFTAGDRCPATYAVGTVAGVVYTAASIRRLANNRAGVTVPSSGVDIVNSQPTPYQVCIYSDATANGKLIGNPVYTVTSVPTVSRVFPAAGPSQGGATVTVYGSNLPTAAGSITATIGGTPLTVTPVTDTYFTAVTPLHAVADDVPLIMTTSIGTFTLPAAYDFANSITVTPNTAANTTPTVDVDVTGVGFLSLPFAAVNAAVNPNTSNAHVYLVNGVYDPASAAGNGTGNKGNGPVAECGNVQVVTDTELFCTLQLNQRRNAAGTFAMPSLRTPTADLHTTAGSPIVTSATAAFTQDDVGAPIKGTLSAHETDNIPANTTIVSVTSPTTAVMSANALLTDTTLAFTVGGVVRADLTGVTVTGGSTTIAKTSGFTSADIGRVVTAASTASIAAGTTIVAVAADGNSATLSKPATIDGPSTVSFYAPSPVPNGVYNLTVVSNGALDAASTVTNYSQSIVSSGSMFSVAPF